MAFTTWYGQLIMGLILNDYVIVTASDGNPYAVKVVQLYNKMAVGDNGDPLNPNDFKLHNELNRIATTDGAITVSSSEVFMNVSFAWSFAGSINLREIGYYADCVDSLGNHYDVLIRRDLQSPTFVTVPATSYTTMGKVSVSVLL